MNILIVISFWYPFSHLTIFDLRISANCTEFSLDAFISNAISDFVLAMFLSVPVPYYFNR